MKNFHKIMGAAALMMLIAAPAVWAQPYSGYGQRFEEGDYWLNSLNLTPEQKENIDRLKREFYETMDALQAELDAQYRKLDELERNPAAARDSLDRTWGHITGIQNRMDERWESHHQKIRNVLTDEQRQKLDEFDYGYGPGYIGTYGYGRGGGYYQGRPGMGTRWAAPRGAGIYPYGRSFNRGRGFAGRSPALPGRSLGRGLMRDDYRGYQHYYRGSGYAAPQRYYNYGRGPCGLGLGKWQSYRDGRGYGWRR